VTLSNGSFWIVVAKDRGHPIWKLAFLIVLLGGQALTVNTFDQTEIITTMVILLGLGGMKTIQLGAERIAGKRENNAEIRRIRGEDS
jgi:hypothetical protein